MKTAQIFIMTGFFVTICALAAWKLNSDAVNNAIAKRSLSETALSYFDDDIKTLTQAKIRAEEAAAVVAEMKEKEKEANYKARIAFIAFRVMFKKIIWIAALSVSCVSVLLLASAGSVVVVRKGTVFHARVNESEFPVKYKDLSGVMPALMGSVQAQIQAALATNEEAAQNRAHSILEDMANMVKAVGGRRGIAQHTVDVTPQSIPALMPSAQIPTFQQAIADFRPSEVVIGYKDNAPVYIPVEGLVSAAVGGETNSGKTSKLRFSVAQLIRNGLHVSILDAHQGIEGSLVDSLGELAALPNVRIFHPFDTKEAVETMLLEVQGAIDNGKKATPPRVYVLDELRPLNRACERVELLMDRLANEGRKYGYYGIFSSQTWEASMFKESGSAARDACVLKMAARMPKDQAHILTKDSKASRQIAKLKTPELYVSSMRFDGIVNVPFASLADMNSIAQEYAQKNAVAVHQNTLSNNAPLTTGCEIMQGTYEDKEGEIKNNVVMFPTKPPEPVAKPEEKGLLETLRYLCDNRPENQSKNQWQQSIAEQSGVSFSLIKNIMAGYSGITEETAQKLTDALKI